MTKKLKNSYQKKIYKKIDSIKENIIIVFIF